MVSQTNTKPSTRRNSSDLSQITPWLFLSGARTVRPNRLCDLGVTCVCNVTSELPEIKLDGIEVITGRILDSQTESIIPILHKMADKLLDVRLREGTALVHCVAGVSRSPSVVLAYFIKHEQMTLRDAFLKVKKARPKIRPNNNFFRQLIEFEIKTHGKASVSLVPIPDFNMFIPDICEEEIKMVNSRSWTEMIRARSNLHNQFA